MLKLNLEKVVSFTQIDLVSGVFGVILGLKKFKHSKKLWKKMKIF